MADLQELYWSIEISSVCINVMAVRSIHHARNVRVMDLSETELIIFLSHHPQVFYLSSTTAIYHFLFIKERKDIIFLSIYSYVSEAS